MSLVGFINMLDLGCALVALILVSFRKTDVLPRNARHIVYALIPWIVFRSGGNALEWLGLTSALDSYEDLVQVLEPMVWAGFFFALITYIQHHERAETQMRLEESEQQLREQLEQKDILLGEIHHRVKNNLNIIISLLRMQSDSINTIEEATHVLNASKERVFSIALVHELVYSSADYSEVRMDNYVHGLVSTLMQNAEYDTRQMSSRMPRFSIECKDLVMNLSRAVPVALIINELLILYTEQCNRIVQEEINIEFFQDSDLYRLSMGYRQDITGAKLVQKADQVEGETLSFSIIRALADQIHSEYDLYLQDNVILRFDMKIPILHKNYSATD